MAGQNLNHNQTAVRPRPQIVIGFDPGLATNHNQTVVRSGIVQGLSYNHNQTLVRR